MRPSLLMGILSPIPACGLCPVVSVQPGRQLLFALPGVFVGISVSPLAQAGPDEALDLAVGLGRVWLGVDVAQTEPLAGCAESEGLSSRSPYRSSRARR